MFLKLIGGGQIEFSELMLEGVKFFILFFYVLNFTVDFIVETLNDFVFLLASLLQFFKSLYLELLLARLLLKNSNLVLINLNHFSFFLDLRLHYLFLILEFQIKISLNIKYYCLDLKSQEIKIILKYFKLRRNYSIFIRLLKF